MKISILLPNLVGGGVERIRIVLAREFLLNGHDVEFVLMQKRGELIKEAESTFRIKNLNISRLSKIPIALAKYLRINKPDLLLVGMWPLTVLAPIARLISGQNCKIIASEHNTLSIQYKDRGYFHKFIMKISMIIGYRLIDYRVGVSLGVIEDIAKLSWMNSEDFNLIYNPLPPRQEPLAKELKKIDSLWTVPKGARILTVGSLKKQKNHPLLLKAFARLNIPNAELMIVGKGDRKNYLLEIAKDLGIDKKVIFPGFFSNPKAFYITADLFVLSSDYEGFGNVIIESMGCGTQVVSTDCPSGPNEIIDNEAFGSLVPVGDEKALSKAIMQSLRNPIDSAILKKRAAKFSSNKSAVSYLNLLNKKIR